MEGKSAKETSRTAWPVALSWRYSLQAFLALIILLSLLYGQTLASMVDTWLRSETFAHGFLILPISLYLAWRRRDRLRLLVPRATPAVLPLLFVLTLVWVLARLADVLVVQQLVVVSMLPVLVWLVFGYRVLQALLFPLLYLYFMVPFGEFLIPRLQDMTAYIAVNALRLSDVPVFWEGLYFSIPSGTFEVAEACSGIRYLIASLALGTLYAYLVYVSIPKRLLFILLCIVVPILANGLRAYGIVMLADLSDYQLATGVDHLIYGWLFFGFVMALLFWIGSRFRDVEAVASQGEGQTGQAPPGGHMSKRRLAATGLVAVVTLLAGPIALAQLRPGGVTYGVQVSLPARLPGFGYSTPIALPSWAPAHEGAAVRQARRYEGPAGRLDLYVAAYGRQQQGKELVRINGRYLSKSWVRSREQTGFFTLADGREVSLRQLLARQGERSITIFQQFYIDGRYTARAVEAKLWETVSALKAHDTVSAIVMFSIAGDPVNTTHVPDPAVILSALHAGLDFHVIPQGQGSGL